MFATFQQSDAMVEVNGESPEATIEGEFFQLTYDHLRDAEGDVIAYYTDTITGGWNYKGHWYSDIVLHASRKERNAP